MLAVFMAMVRSGTTQADDTRYVVRHFGPERGLPVGSAIASRTDADGFLWVATHDGLARFDGQDFRLYALADQPEMGSNRLIGLHDDGASQLYALTITGDLLQVRSDGIRRLLPGSNAMDRVRFVQADPLCATTFTGLFCADGAGGLTRRLEFDTGLDVVAALPLEDGAAWLIDADRGIFLIEGARQRLLYRAPGGRWLNDAAWASPSAVVSTSDTLTVVLATGILLLERSGASSMVPFHDPLSILQLEHIEDVLWVGTTKGLYALKNGKLERMSDEHADSGVARRWRAPDGALVWSDESRLYRNGELILSAEGQIQDVFYDSERTAWVSTLRDGLHALSSPRVTMLDNAAGLRNENIYGISRAPDDRMWIGSLDGEVQVIDPHDRIETYGPAQGLPGRNPWLATVARDGTAYVGTYAGGLHRKRPGETDFSPVHIAGMQQNARVLSLAFDSRQRLWLGTSSGAWRQTESGWADAWTGFGTVHAMLPGDGDAGWFGTDSGLWRVRPSRIEQVASDHLQGVTIRDLYLDSRGWLWVCTEGRGLILIREPDAADPQAVRFARHNGLPSDSPHAVLEDSSRNIWVNSNQGVFRLSQDNIESVLSRRIPALSPFTLGIADGLIELEGNGGVYPAAARGRDGFLWFPSQSGVIRVDPTRISARPAPSKVIIDSLEYRDLRKTEGLSQPAELPHGVRSLQVRFTAADLRSGDRMQFRYRLLPHDSEWQSSGTRRSVSFAALSPDEYRFEVMASNGDGAWSESAAALAISLPAYWYETTSFRAAVVVASVLLAGLMMQQRVRRARRQAIELERQLALRTAEIRQRNRDLANEVLKSEELSRFRAKLLTDFCHEIRRPLTLVSLPLQELAQRNSGLPQTRQRHLRLATQQVGRLQGLVDQLVTLVRARASLLSLEVSSFDLCGVLTDLCESFRVSFRQRDISYAVECWPRSIRIFADRQKLITIAGCLLDNAGQYAPTGSRISVTVTADPAREKVIVAVVDSGSGFDPQNTERLFQRHWQEENTPRHAGAGMGIGLALVRELVELHGGCVGADGKPGVGARFWFELPLGSAHVAIDEVTPGTSVPESAPGSESIGGDGGILVVEDDVDLASYLGERLSELMPIHVVHHAAAALEAMQHKAFNVVLTDIVLPDIDGIALCRRIRTLPANAAPPVLIMSARTDAGIRDEGLRAGAMEYLEKPFSFDALLNAIGRAWPALGKRLAHGGIVEGEAVDPVLKPALDALTDPEFHVDTWAGKVHLSERQLRRKVTELTGWSPVAWLREQRLLRVRHLVDSGQCRTLAQAGQRCGIDNPAYLYRLYRARFGTAAGQ